MKVSVVIPTYNRPRRVVQALESVLAQTHRDFEVIIVDDGSTDETRERLRPLLHESRVRYVYQNNAGVAAARNAGIARSSAEIVSFLDSDDLWKPNKLECEVSFMSRHPEAGGVFSDLEKHDGELFIGSFMRGTLIFSRLLDGNSYADGFVVDNRFMFLCILQEVPIKPSALSIRKESLKKTGLFDESRRFAGEDWEFLLRFCKAERLGYIDRPLAVLRISTDALHRNTEEGRYPSMRRLFLRERKSLAHDREALAAVNEGLKNLCRHWAWHYEDEGRIAKASQALLQGFFDTGDPALLARAAGVFLPEPMKELAKGLLFRGRIGLD